jgi:hypothetical protein
VSGGTPPEPTGPSPTGEAFRPLWLVGWLVVAAALLVVLGFAWVAGVDVPVLGTLGAGVAGAVSVALHHVVVTQDAGERQLEREETADLDIPELIERRHLVAGALGVGVLGLGGLFVLRRLGPTPPEGSAWDEGSPLVTVDGVRVRPEDIPVGGVITVWPEGYAGTERAAVMLIRLRDAPVGPEERAAEEAQVTRAMRGLDPSWRWEGPEIPRMKPLLRGVVAAEDLCVELFVPQSAADVTRGGRRTERT